MEVNIVQCLNALRTLFVLYPLYSPFLEILAAFTWLRLQPPQDQRYPVLQVHAGPVRVSVIHRTLTWTTGSVKRVCDHSYACVYTRGCGHTDNESTQHFCAPDGVRTRVNDVVEYGVRRSAN